MASAAEHTIDIIFSGIDRVAGVIDSIDSDIDSFGKSMKGLSDISAPFVDLTEKILTLEAAFGAIGIAIIKSRGDIVTATKEIEATLDITSEKAKELEPVFKSLYSEGFADSIEQAAESVKLAFQKFGDVGTDELDSITAKALTLQKAFGTDLNESMNAASTLMKSFGISSSQAFDFISAGFQQGLNGSDDFIQSITEYSTQFANGGASADQFFSIMKTGYQDGYLGADKAADAFKEFRVRIQDGSKTTAEALQSLGIDAQELGDKMSSGGTTAAQAFELVIKKLNETDDSSLQMQAGVGLIGSQFEDLGTKAALNLDLSAVKMDELTGKAGELQDKLQDTAPFEKFWRTLTTEIGDIPIFDQFYDEAVKVVTEIKNILPEVFDNLDFSEVEKSLDNLKNIISGWFGDADITTVEGLQSVIQKVVDTFVSFQNTANGVWESLEPIFVVISKLIESYNSLDSETQSLIGSFIGIGAQVSVVTGGIATVAGTTKTLNESLSGGVGKFTLWAGAAFAAFEAGYKLGEYLRSLSPEVDKTAEGFFRWADSIIDFTGTAGKASDGIDEFTQKMLDEAKAMQGARKTTDEVRQSVENLPKKAEVDIQVKAETVPQQIQKIRDSISTLEKEKLELEAKLINATGDAKDEILSNIQEIELGISQARNQEISLTTELDTKNTQEFLKNPDSFLEISNIPIKTELDKKAAQDDVNELVYYVNGKEYIIKVKPDKVTSEKTKEELEKIVPPEKQLKILADLELGKFQEETKKFDIAQQTIQKKMQFKAELDIKDAELNAQTLGKTLDNLGTMFSAAGSVISDSFGALAGLDFGSAMSVDIFRLIKDQIREQNEIQRDTLEQNEKALEAQLALNKAKEARLRAGKPMIEITVDGSGLQYQLESILYEIMKFAQVKAAEEGLESLLGI